MKIKTVKAFPRALCIACLVFSISLVGCFSAAPSTDTDASTPEITESEAKSVFPETAEPDTTSGEYILSLKTKKFHDKACPWVNNIKNGNKAAFTGDKDELISQGYAPCGTCLP